MNRYVLCLWIFTVLSCTPEKDNSTEDRSEFTQIQDSAYTVSIIEISKKKFSAPINVLGKVVPYRSVPLSFNSSGKLNEINFTNGSYVRKNAVIATLYNEREKLNVREAQVALRKANRDFEDLLAEFPDSLRRAFWPRIRENLALKAGIEQKQIALEKAELELEGTYLTAPFSGIIDGLKLQKGEIITSNTELVTIQDIQKYHVEVELLEFDVQKLSSQTNATVSTLYDQQKIYKAQIQEIDPRVKPDGYVAVKLELLGKSDFMAGMSVQVLIEVSHEESIVVPKEAVVKKSGKAVVFTVEEEKAKWNYVTLGKENDDEVQILEGIKLGNKVIVSNNLQLAHDTPVKIIEIGIK